MKSVMVSQERFAQIQAQKIRRSTFDRSHGHKTTVDAGLLYPILVDEALPGDTFKLKPTVFGRIATPLKPIMDNIYVDVHFFSVPNRLLWDNWIYFMGEQVDVTLNDSYLVPTITSTASTGYDEESIFDYFGLPTKVADFDHSALPLRAYNKIWNEWYRDEDIVGKVTEETGDSDVATNYSLQSRAKRKDYFTSARPFAQKGTAPNLLNQASAIDITSNGEIPQFEAESVQRNFVADATTNNLKLGGAGLSGTVNPIWGDETGLQMDASALGLTINEFRTYATIQQMLERDARGGTRYPELIFSHFNVVSPDARLQRPEYLGGCSTPLTMTPIPQQSETDAGTPQGNLAAMGTFALSQNGFIKTFTEHETILGLLSVRADLNYQSGLNRMWSRQTRYDFYWPALEGLGEQAVLKKELNMDYDSQFWDDAFGYQERWSEYKYKPSQITGLYRSNATNSLDIWHLAQDFGTDIPQLAHGFIHENPPMDRVVAVPSEPKFLVDIYFNYKCARPMMTYSNPGLRML